MDHQATPPKPSLPLHPHIIIIAYPFPSHIHSMLNLAQLLCLSHLKVTFITTVHARNNLLCFSDVISRFRCYSGFRFETIPDGLPHGLTDDHRSSGVGIVQLLHSLSATAKPFLKEIVVTSGGEDSAPQRCIIADGFANFAVDVAEEVGVPIISFHPVSAAATWAYFSIPSLIQAGELPFNGKDMDEPILSVKGMEKLLRRRDLPGNCRVDDLEDPFFKFMMEFRKCFRTKHHIINSFQELEGSTLDQMRIGDMLNVYAIGPLHELLRNKLGSCNVTLTTSSNGLHEDGKKCMDWLDRQPPNSVLYVCFGTLTLVSEETLAEFWHGLMNSGQRFLWALNPRLVLNKKVERGEVPTEILNGLEGRCCVVEWAPQQEVLAHSAVGGFLTHCGWNSIMESIVAGVPMIGWPFYADQQVNSRFLGEVWKIGLDMKDTCDRHIIEKMVRDLMEVRKDEFLQRAKQFANSAKECAKEGGSSISSLENLIEDIKRM
ncbi:PREDICTED: 7-deoxyloganetic acid glucosyltransferase-like [Ipomoea nil]|uniref:7-deoxyloganetic acid glucosyltransferase-like n=1 Tax=Ipomoea nil TaxID=35883 RepID=UPI000900DCAA|nr:PREDICTED: 7-deoxyloganetic acid glucosyltransferase-like [Ipomoea nil]